MSELMGIRSKGKGMFTAIYHEVLREMPQLTNSEFAALISRYRASKERKKARRNPQISPKRKRGWRGCTQG